MSKLGEVNLVQSLTPTTGWVLRDNRSIEANQLTPGRVRLPLPRQYHFRKVATPNGTSLRGSPLFFGTPTGTWTGGSTIHLNPCDVHDVVTGEGPLDVFVLSDGASINIDEFDPNGDGIQNTDCEFNTSDVLSFSVAANGSFYLIGEIGFSITRLRVVAAEFKFQCRIAFTMGGAVSSESGWLDWHTGDECPDVLSGGSF